MTPNTDRNEQLFERAKQLIPGGVNSPVRAFRAVGGTPRFVARAQGAYFWDANGKRHIDYIGSWGPMILGHGHAAVLEAVQRECLLHLLDVVELEHQRVLHHFGRDAGARGMAEGGQT